MINARVQNVWLKKFLIVQSWRTNEPNLSETVDDMQIKSPTELDMTPILHKPYTYSVHNEAQLTVVSKAES